MSTYMHRMTNRVFSLELSQDVETSYAALARDSLKAPWEECIWTSKSKHVL